MSVENSPRPSAPRSVSRYFYWSAAGFSFLILLLASLSLGAVEMARQKSDDVSAQLLPRAKATQHLAMEAGHLVALGADLSAAVSEAERHTVMDRILFTRQEMVRDLDEMGRSGLDEGALTKTSETIRSLSVGIESQRQLLAQRDQLTRNLPQSQETLTDVNQRLENIARRQSELLGRLLFVASSQSEDASAESIRQQRDTANWAARIEWLLGLTVVLSLMLLFGVRRLYRQNIDSRLQALEGAIIQWRDNRDWPEALKTRPGSRPDQIDAMYQALREALDEVDRRAEELQQSNVELEQFAYVASHDLRQPLRMVSSYLTLIKRMVGPEPQGEMAEYFAYAIDGANRMDEMILDLLDYSRIGRVGVAFEPVSLGEVMGDALQHLKPAIDDAEALVRLQSDLGVVVGCRSELTRLFQNIIGNAVKYRLEDRPVHIEITAKDDGDERVISVRDNGMGIRAEDFERVFGIFQRLVSRSQFEGTGIGLAVCKKIAEHHGGRIWIESQPGMGSSFFVALPKTQETAA